MEEWKEYKLGEVAIPVRDRIETSCLDLTSYISTENMLPEKAGVTLSSGVPSGNAIKFRNEDILISNIRPYFKKIWRADRDGGCSADVICLRASDVVEPLFLYYLLSQDLFFDYVMQGAKGTKMPRGDKNQIMQWPVLLPPKSEQHKIASILSALDDKIEVNRQINDNFVIEPLFEILLIWKLTTLINDNLEQQGQTLFEEYVMNPNKPRTQLLSDYALINPVRTIAKGRAARCIDMSSLPTKGTFPNDWTFKEYNGGMKFQNGDTIMARITPCLENGKTAYINFLDDDEVAYGSTEYIVLSAQEGFCSELLYFLARHGDFISYAVAHMNGSSGRQRVSGNDIANYIMPEITKDALDVVSEKLRGIMEVIKNNSLESRRLAEIRDALLPRLMSGELKLEETNM